MRANFLLVLILISSFLLVHSNGPFVKTIGNFVLSAHERGYSILSFTETTPAKGPVGLRLYKLFETVGMGVVEGSSVDLSGLIWVVSDLIVEKDTILKFNITMQQSNNTNFGLSLLFTAFFPNATTISCKGDFCVSFDMLVSKYVWKNPASKLVLLYDIFDGNKNASDGDGTGQSNIRVTTTNAFFQIDSVVLLNETKKENHNFSLSLVPDGNDKGINVKYDHFSENLVLDSTLSVGVTYIIIPAPPTVDQMVLIIGLVVSIVIVLILFLAGCVYLRKNRSGYAGV